MRRRSCANRTRTYRRRYVAVGTRRNPRPRSGLGDFSGTSARSATAAAAAESCTWRRWPGRPQYRVSAVHRGCETRPRAGSRATIGGGTSARRSSRRAPTHDQFRDLDVRDEPGSRGSTQPSRLLGYPWATRPRSASTRHQPSSFAVTVELRLAKRQLRVCLWPIRASRRMVTARRGRAHSGRICLILLD